MDKKRSRRAVRGVARVDFPLGRFLERLHQCIGGAGPIGQSSTECPAFRRDHPDHSLDAGDFRVEYLWAHIMRKYDDGKPSSAKREAALNAMLEAEKQCSLAPMRFKQFSHNPYFLPALRRVGTVDAVIHTASKKIAAVLGEFTWAEASRYVGFGPGATTNLPRKTADLWHKFGTEVPQASSACVPLISAYLGRRNSLWREFLLGKWGVTHTICDANHVTTVPKNYETDRPIAIEPLWNMFFQKGIGGVIRERLKRVGVDLNDQSINRRRARDASMDGLSATIDLSNASDTVSRWLVHELLPADWVAAMERCRSPYSVLPSGERILLRKFSSMGNGFTFELESLIFWAISSTVVQMVREDSKLKDHRVNVYGDDIIVPSDCYGPLVDALMALGFTANATKSYAVGPFRESCGMHAYLGHDVTPFYIRRPVNSLQDLFLLHNNIVRWASRRLDGVRDARVRELCRWVRSFAPNEWRKPRLCDGYGDGAFIGSFDEVRPDLLPSWKKFQRRWQTGFTTEVWAERPLVFDARRAKKRTLRGEPSLFEDTPRLLRTLWNLRNSSAEGLRPDTSHDVSISRGAFGSSQVYVWMWTEIGPWIDFHDDSSTSSNNDGCTETPAGATE